MNGNLHLNRNLLERGCVLLVWAGSSAWLGVLTLRIERPPYTRKPSSEGRRVGSSNLPRPTKFAYFRPVFVFLLCVARAWGDLLRVRFSYLGWYNSTSTSPGIRKCVSNPQPSSVIPDVNSTPRDFSSSTVFMMSSQ